MAGIEPTLNCLKGNGSTIELHSQIIKNRLIKSRFFNLYYTMLIKNAKSNSSKISRKAYLFFITCKPFNITNQQFIYNQITFFYYYL